MLETYFKNEDRKKGESLLRSVSLSGSSDLRVRAFVEKNKVSLVSLGIDSAVFSASCSCASGRKGRLCAHIYVVVLKLEGSDFLSAKTEIVGTSPPDNEFRKQQVSRHKKYLRKQRAEKKGPNTNAEPRALQYPADVEKALRFFSANGFLFEALDMDAVTNAKKLLSRVFHPDKGGSHDEILELNHNFDVIAEYLKS